MKNIKKRMTKGVTLIELVVTMTLVSIMSTILGTFLYFFININSQVDRFVETVDNANMLAYVVRDLIDQRNDGKIVVDSDSSVLLSYDDGGNITSLIYDDDTDELKFGDSVIFTSKDLTLTIEKTWFATEGLVRFDITYSSGNKNLSFIKAIY